MAHAPGPKTPTNSAPTAKRMLRKTSFHDTSELKLAPKQPHSGWRPFPRSLTIATANANDRPARMTPAADANGPRRKKAACRRQDGSDEYCGSSLQAEVLGVLAHCAWPARSLKISATKKTSPMDKRSDRAIASLMTASLSGGHHHNPGGRAG